MHKRRRTLRLSAFDFGVAVGFSLLSGIFQATENAGYNHAPQRLIFTHVADFFAGVRIVCPYSASISCLKGVTDPLFSVGEDSPGIVTAFAVSRWVGGRIVHAPIVRLAALRWISKGDRWGACEGRAAKGKGSCGAEPQHYKGD